MFFAGQVLETGVQDSARLILTGQAQNGSYTKDQFKTDICNRISTMFSCSGLYVDVQSYSSFNNVSITSPISNSTFVDTTQYSPGNAGDIVVIQVTCNWPLLTPVVAAFYQATGGKYKFSVAATMRNEAF